MEPHEVVKVTSPLRLLVRIQIARHCSDERRGEQSGFPSMITEYMKDAIDFEGQFDPGG